VPDDQNVLLYIGVDDPRDADVLTWLNELERSGVDVARATGHEAGRLALQAGVTSVLVLSGSLGRASCLYLLREAHARNHMPAAIIVREPGTLGDERSFIEAGASALYDAAELAAIDLNDLETDALPKAIATSSDNDPSQFLARVSHEIRTPLHGIHGAMDLLEETSLTPMQQEYIHIVRNAADALMSVVQDLVDYAQPRRDPGRTSAFPFEPRTCMEQVATVMAPRAMARGMDFVHVTRHDVPWRVQGDPNALRQVLGGLASLVIRHTANGTVAMFASAVKSGLRFEIGVEDCRAPAAPNHHNSGDDGADDVSLERCAKIVAALGGELRSHVTASGAARYDFAVPFGALPDTLPLMEVGMAALEGKEVLVVDDTVTNRVVFREQLANWGCEVIEAVNGADAVDVLESRHARGDSVAIGLIDFAMPELDGEQLARAIRQMPEYADMPLVLCTSTPRGGDAARMTEAGFDAYLTKPVRSDVLRKTMCLLLGSRKSDRERTPLITQHIVDEMERAAQSTLYIGSAGGGLDVVLALQSQGFPCDTAEHGADAERALSANRYGAVLVECRGAKKAGLAEAERIRKTEGTQRIPLLMILRRANADDQAACLAAGGDAVLVEPIHREELKSVLGAYLGLEDLESLDDAPETWNLVDPIAEFGEPISANANYDNAPVDMARLDEVTAGDRELRGELIDMFLADTEERFAVLETAIARQNAEELNRTAHSLKGSCANLGVETLQALALALEGMGKENRLDEAPETFEQLKTEYEVVKVFFGSL
jgi:two-component system, sensor histidine kinase and response regulator